jgi:RNA polymerase sigma-70 factor (ECF subfamily)
LELVIDAWGDDVLRLAVSILGSRADAEDVFQTVFLRLCRSDRDFVDDEHVKAWLLRVTINCCKDELKSARRQRVIPLEAAASGGLMDTLAEEGAADSDHTVESRLAAALETLPTKQRTALHLFYYEGFSTDEIASLMDEIPATVRSCLHRARKQLRTRLGGHHE